MVGKLRQKGNKGGGSGGGGLVLRLRGSRVEAAILPTTARWIVFNISKAKPAGPLLCSCSLFLHGKERMDAKLRCAYL